MPQATVKHFDPETGAGTLMLDSKEEVTFDGGVFGASGLLELRLGQRVRLEYDDSGDTKRATKLDLVSF
jgi:cold shock CspA family protein